MVGGIRSDVRNSDAVHRSMLEHLEGDGLLAVVRELHDDGLKALLGYDDRVAMYRTKSGATDDCLMTGISRYKHPSNLGLDGTFRKGLPLRRASALDASSGQTSTTHFLIIV